MCFTLSIEYTLPTHGNPDMPDIVCVRDKYKLRDFICDTSRVVRRKKKENASGCMPAFKSPNARRDDFMTLRQTAFQKHAKFSS